MVTPASSNTHNAHCQPCYLWLPEKTLVADRLKSEDLFRAVKMHKPIEASTKTDEGDARGQPGRRLLMTNIKAIHVVHATWCPHCHPTTVEPVERLARELGVHFFSYDVDISEQAAKADELVRKFGDWSEDYLVPQVFVETMEGKIQHVLTGYSESVDSTKRAVNNLLNSPLFASVNSHGN